MDTFPEETPKTAMRLSPDPGDVVDPHPRPDRPCARETMSTMTSTPRRLSAVDLVTYTPGLAALLVDAVEDGASVGFLAPLAIDGAAEWWAGQAGSIRGNRTILWATADASGVTGTVQLHLAPLPNSRNRASIAKLLVHRRARNNGVARRLLSAAEQFATESGITLLTLDTETGSPAETLYKKTGWTESGTIPAYAADPSGTLRSTTILYKELPPRQASASLV